VPYDISRLLSTLNSTRLQQENNALYQVIFQLIKGFSDLQGSVGSGSISNDITEINQIFQISYGSREGGGSNRPPIPGPQGIQGNAGLNGASLPGPLGIIKHYVESYPKYIPILGNQGNPGTTGAQGPIGPFIPSRFVEITKSPVQIFSSVSSGGSGSYQRLGSQTASASATLPFTSLITSAYNIYDFILENIILTTDNVDLLMRTSTDNGSTYDSGASDYGYASWINNTGASTDNVASAGASSIRLMPDSDNTAGVASICGTIRLFNPLNSAVYKHLEYHLSYRNNNNQFYNFIGSAWRLSAADIDAVQFLPSAGGTIASGTIEMFGVKNS
jgi:hypothetical protein